MSNVKNGIQEAANRFAAEVLGLLRGATLQEILTITGKGGELGTQVEAAAAPVSRGPGRPPRAAAEKGKSRRRTAGRKRSPEEVNKTAERVIEFLRNNKQEVGVSGISAALKLSTADLALPLQKLRTEGRIKTHGQRRSTTYRLA